MPWEFSENAPIYLQIIEYIKTRIATGEYRAGDKLMPVRDLAAEAAVNPNTMQKALTELESEGLLSSVRTTGRYVTEDAEMIKKLKAALATGYTDVYLNKTASLGLSGSEVLNTLKIRLEERGNV